MVQRKIRMVSHVIKRVLYAAIAKLDARCYINLGPVLDALCDVIESPALLVVTWPVGILKANHLGGGASSVVGHVKGGPVARRQRDRVLSVAQRRQRKNGVVESVAIEHNGGVGSRSLQPHGHCRRIQLEGVQFHAIQ